MSFLIRMLLPVACAWLVGCGGALYAAEAPELPAAPATDESPTTSDEAEGAPASPMEDTDPSAVTVFREELEPYGTWSEHEAYGTIWTPSPSQVGTDFTPYVSAGHWVYEDEPAWVSDYAWGAVPFHYGRWVYIAGHGWAWIPGRRYASAWVTWRVGYDSYAYVGWAPLAPTWYWRGGMAYGIATVPYAPYSFCPSEDLFHPMVSSRIVAGPQVAVVAAHTKPYVPASPGVSGYRPASPSVGGAPVPARPSVRGPSLGALKTPEAQAAVPSVRDRQVLHRASAFAGPAPRIGALRAYVSTTPRTSDGIRATPYASGPRYFPSRGGHTGPSTSVWVPPPSPGMRAHVFPSFSRPAPSYSAPSHSAPAPRSFSSPPVVRSAPSFSAPSFRPSPSFSAPAPRSFSAPARSAPSFSAPSFRSAPSVSSSRSSSSFSRGRR